MSEDNLGQKLRDLGFAETPSSQIEKLTRELAAAQQEIARRRDVFVDTQSQLTAAQKDLAALRRKLELCERDAELANKPKRAHSLSIHGMYDCHLFHAITGKSVDEIIENWRKHNSEKHPAIVGGEKWEDLGPSCLCPVIVLNSDDKELRRVGKMIFENYKPEQLEAYRAELLADSDIPRLLALADSQRDSKAIPPQASQSSGTGTGTADK